jgi:tetratricopeptide (TPR) repeat protein
LWEYGDAAASEERFRAALDSAEGDVRLELLTQIARTFSLRERIEEAHEVLDMVEEKLDEAGARPRARYLLERGRTFNSCGQKRKARGLFLDACEFAVVEQMDGLAVDAAHMVAITLAGRPEAIEWNQRGLEIARTSQDPKARALIPAMLNNNGWDLHELGRFDEALLLFEEALAEWTASGKSKQIQIAKWSVARCLRSLERYDEALGIQQELAVEHEKMGSVDGYVFEETAENLAALNRKDEARSYFGKAYDELSKDDWFVKNEATRLAQMKTKSGDG